MREEENRLVMEMVGIIVPEVDPEAMILFGARARGDVRSDADVNVLVVETEPFIGQRSRRQESMRVPPLVAPIEKAR